MTWDNDYAFIQVFIDYLKQILDMIISFFNSLGGSADNDAAEE